MAGNLPVIPNRLTGEAAPNTLNGLNRSTPLGLASAPTGGLMAVIPGLTAGQVGRRLVRALVLGAIALIVVLLAVVRF